MSRHFTAGCALVVGSLATAAQTPSSLIDLQPVKTLDGDAGAIRLHPANGAILVLGFSRESNPQTRAWSEQLHAALRASSNDVPGGLPLYNVVILAGAPRLIRRLVRRAIRNGVPEAQRSTYYIVEDDDAFWRALALVDDEDRAYVLRLDPTGRVCKRLVGAVTEAALAELFAPACSGSGDAS